MISIIISYYNRKKLLLKTIRSIIENNDSDILKQTEIIIVDDNSDRGNSLNGIYFPHDNIKIVSISNEEKWWSCPCPSINKGIAESSGDILLLQGAEIMHQGNILKVLGNIKNNQYYVFGCLSLSKDGTDDIWYQHSLLNPRCYNFCTGITKKDMLELNGFDERYGWGISYGDDDFIRRVRLKQMEVIQIDEPFTKHQYHDPMQTKPFSKNISDLELFNYICNNETDYKNKNNSYLKNNDSQ